MALTTLIPNDNPAYTSSNWLLHNGSGNYYSILIDNDDTTYIHSLGDDNAIMYPLTDMPVDFSFASSVTINVRENNNGIPADSFPLLFQIINGNDGVTPLTTINALYDSSSISDYSVQLSVIGATDSGTWNNALLKILTGSVNNNRITSVYEISVSLTYNVNVTDLTGGGGSVNGTELNGSANFQHASNPAIPSAGLLGSNSTNGYYYIGQPILNEVASGGNLNGQASAYVNGLSINPVISNFISSGGLWLKATSKQLQVLYKPNIISLGVVCDGNPIYRTIFSPKVGIIGPCLASGSVINNLNKSSLTNGVGCLVAGSVTTSINHTETTSGIGCLVAGVGTTTLNQIQSIDSDGGSLNGVAVVNTSFGVIASPYGVSVNGYNIKLYIASSILSGGISCSGTYVLQQTYASQPIFGGIRIFGENPPDFLRPINTQPHRNYALLMKTPNIINKPKPNPNAIINPIDTTTPTVAANRFEILTQPGYCSFGQKCKNPNQNGYLPDIVKKRQPKHLPPAQPSTTISNDQIATATGV